MHRTSLTRANPAHKNPYEVRSTSGLEGVYANEGDAEFHADELRRSGVSGVVVERRVHQRGGMARSNPTGDFGGPHPDWAESNENAVRDALARSSTEFAEVLGRFPQSVSSSDRAKYRKGDHKREFFELPDWKRVYVLTEYGLGDPVSDADIYQAFQKAVEYLKRVTGEEWMWESINPGKQVFVMLDRARDNPSSGRWAGASRTITNLAQSLEVQSVAGLNMLLKYVPVEVAGVGYGWLFKITPDGHDVIVEMDGDGIQTFASSQVTPVAGHVPESPTQLALRAKYKAEDAEERRERGNPARRTKSNPPGALTSDHLMFIGASLRDELVEEIDSTDWDNVVADRAAKVKSLLLGAAKQGKGFVIDTRRLTSKDYEFLSDNLEDGVAWNMRNIESSRGVRMGDLRRQIRDLREAIGRFGGVLPEENPARRTKSNPPGALTSDHLMFIGASLRDELVEEIDSTDWDNVVADRAAKVKSLLLGAAKQGKGFVIDTRRLTSKDYEFLSDNLEDGVAWNMRNIESSRGVRMGDLRRQIRDLREAIGRFGGVLPEENPARRTKSNPPGALTSDHLMFIGASLRDELVEEIDSTDWDNVVADRAAKVKSLLLGAAKQGKGFVIDTRRLTSKDYEFLSDNLEDGVAWNMRNIESSRGVRMGDLRRQIRDLREAIGRFGGVLPEENPARLTRSNPPGDLTYGHFYETGGQDCANVISLDEFDLDLGTAEQIVAEATSDWDDDLERDWRSQMDDEDFEGLDPHEAFEQWKAGWRARAVRIIADRLKERRDEDE